MNKLFEVPDSGTVTTRAGEKRELDNFERFQLEKYGNILKPTETTLYNGFDPDNNEMDRLQEWVEQQAERQLEEQES